MMGPSRIAIAACFLVFASMALAETEERAPEAVPEISRPVQLVRTLQLMQDKIAEGSTEAHVGQRQLLTVLDARFMELEDQTWQNVRNIQAAVTYVLSGGTPQVLRKLLYPRLIPMEEVPVVEGALAYVEGREGEAKQALLNLDPLTMPPGAGAQMAMVQAALLVGSEPRRSMELLDFVRLQAPGTLLEEAALRRQVFVASQIDDAKRFEFLVGEYLQRYRSSVYAGNFRQRLAAALTRVDFGKDPERFSRVKEVLNALDPLVRADLLLLVARSSLDQGLVKSALITAEEASRLVDGSKPLATRAQLYRAAAMIVTPSALEIGLRELERVDRSNLAPYDLALLETAISTAQQIKRLPAGRPEGGNVAVAPKSSSEVQAPEPLPAIIKAQDALRRVDKLIKN
jgi:chemotaxis protein MotC